jgi:hypothetical protein
VTADSLVYSLVQLIHNFGAAFAVGTPAVWLWRGPPLRSVSERMLAMVAVLWLLQALSGAGFGMASWWFYGALPDLNSAAASALSVKIVCALAAVVLCSWALLRRGGAERHAVWVALMLLAAIALGAAAFLRWTA